MRDTLYGDIVSAYDDARRAKCLAEYESIHDEYNGRMTHVVDLINSALHALEKARDIIKEIEDEYGGIEVDI